MQPNFSDSDSGKNEKDTKQKDSDKQADQINGEIVDHDDDDE